MYWFIFSVVLFVLAFIISFVDEDNAILVWCLCFVATMAIIIGKFEIPTAMDLHAGKAVIKYEVVDGIKVDSTFVFRD